MIKGWVKSLFPQNYWNSLSWWRERFGVLAALRTHARLLYSGDGLLRVPVSVAGTRAHVYLRPGTSDLDVFDEIFLQNEYGLDVGQPQSIIDAGAHIGLSAVFFALRFPAAQVVALEPEDGNFRMLSRNVASLSNVRAVCAGLWARTSRLKVVDPGHSSWGFRVVESEDGEGIEALGLSDLLSQLKEGARTLVKIDIEGSEIEVLSTSAQWLPSVDVVIIELHDRFRPGCTSALDQALAGYCYDRSTSGESVVVRNLQPRF